MTLDRVPIRADLAELTPYGAPQLDVPVRLNTNETPWAPPPEFFDDLARRLRDLPLNRYPDRRAWELRSALGERFDRTPEEVWAASGSNELLQQLLQAYGGPGRRVLLFRPGYSMHPLLARVSLTEVVTVDLDGELRLTPEAAAAAVAEHAPDLVLIASPNNPTGLPVDVAALEALHDGSRALIVLDQAYAEFAGPGEQQESLALLDRMPRLVLSRTFSKAWRMAGARLGYLIGPSWVVDDLRLVRLPYHLDALVQVAGVVALQHAEAMTDHIEAIAAERERVAAALRDLGVQVWPSRANFLLFRTDMDGGLLFQRLLDRGVLVRDFSTAPLLERCLRVTIGTREEDDAFLAALKESLT